MTQQAWTAFWQDGFAAAHILFDRSPSEGTLFRLATHLWASLSRHGPVRRFSLYVRTHEGELREVVLVEDGQVIVGDEVMRLSQLPETLRQGTRPWRVYRGRQYETWVPCSHAGEVFGMLVLATEAEPLFLPDEGMTCLGEALAIGLRHYLAMALEKGRRHLLESLTKLSHRLAEATSEQEIVSAVVEMAVRLLGFDRAVLFLFEENGILVRDAVYARTGRQAERFARLPAPPVDSWEPVAVEEVPGGMWVPLLAGSRRIAALWVDNLYSQEPAPPGALSVLVDLGRQAVVALERAQLIEKLNVRAHLDDLTGVHRVKYFYEQVEQWLAYLERENRPAATVLCDLDHFKQVNDTYGHPAGDAVLVQVAIILKSQCRASDIVGRIGGDEFVLFLPGCSMAAAKVFAERLTETVAQHPFRLPDGRVLALSLSVGTAVYPDDGRTVQELIHLADRALYVSKRTGRNRASMASSMGMRFEPFGDGTPCDI
ncbi:hypothetical protein GCM10010885_03690 [Alicyclobacillus cellulosilyticus]|uniref:GGDEF domain-containing protein n=1 Tax=Alicyclobacillus cellulosilyticus TaxID=1003997 RepID=A0A917NFY4_9BACL|nr:sensor domain-containing diguanylate cyclase [Alicyclobacillus cellulosilyticus]GGI97348.1 hypothetical protein GCM10010885_03690 [Alicyclobacillus cellulosilyticus]